MSIKTGAITIFPDNTIGIPIGLVSHTGPIAVSVIVQVDPATPIKPSPLTIRLYTPMLCSNLFHSISPCSPLQNPSPQLPSLPPSLSLSLCLCSQDARGWLAFFQQWVAPERYGFEKLDSINYYTKKLVELNQKVSGLRGRTMVAMDASTASAVIFCPLLCFAPSWRPSHHRCLSTANRLHPSFHPFLPPSLFFSDKGDAREML